MSIPIEAPPERPGHVGHTPQPWVNLGMRLGRFHDLAGGVFGSGIVRALLGQEQSQGVLGADTFVEYAAQPFGIPGRASDRAKPPTPEQRALAHAHTVLALEETTYKQTWGGDRQGVPSALKAALDDMRTWKAPR